MNTLSPGEARIRRAFRISLAVLAGLALAGGLLWLVLSPAKAPPKVAAKAPTLPLQTHAPTPEPPRVSFHDITTAAGIHFTHINGAYGERLMPETIGGGLAFIDYDRDGDPDLFLVNSTYWPGHEAGPPPRQALYRNDGRGHFTEVGEAAGLALTFYGMGAAVGDYDNDGWDDLFVSALGRDHLFHNEGGRFREVTESAGVGGGAHDWSTSAAFLDYDNDGDLDLFVGHYVQWSREIDLAIGFRLTGLGRAYGAPNHFVGTHSRLYRNEGDGHFRDVSAAAGIEVNDPRSGRPLGKALGVVPVDYDRDGWMDILVANDTVRNFLFHNLGDGRFEEVGEFEGLAYDRDGRSTSGMGMDAAWYRNDPDLGVAIGNFANEMTSLLVTHGGRPPFADEAMAEGIGAPSRLALSFAMLFLDYDLDGRQDLFEANGHLEKEINKVQPSQHYAQPPQLFWNCGPDCPHRFVWVRDCGDLCRPLVARGAAYADIDADGDLDLAVAQNGRPALLFRNDQALDHHWLRLRLVGTRANRDGIGALVELTAGGVTQTRQLTPARGFLSQVEMPLLFGLGPATRVARLRVHWPGGGVQEIPVPGVDRTLEITQPETPHE